MDENVRVLSSWTNGRVAEVRLLEDGNGKKTIQKQYRRGHIITMMREYLVMSYLCHRVPILPRVLRFKPSRRQIIFSYINGVRLLEWVLERYADPGTDITAFKSFHGLESDPVVSAAFQRFRDSDDSECTSLKEAIMLSYAMLHRVKFVHGDPSPRNLIYDGKCVHIIDFDHSRPSLNPEKVDAFRLFRWYGVKC